MRIGIVSDSHSNLYMLDKALSSMGKLDRIIHLGDHYQDIIKINEKYKLNIDYVQGNNDYMKEPIMEKSLEVAGNRIFMTHGHRYQVYYGIDRLYFKALECEANIVLYGHTHVQNMIEHRGILFINPGSVSLPRDGKPGCGVIEIDDGGEIEVKLIRLEI